VNEPITATEVKLLNDLYYKKLRDTETKFDRLSGKMLSKLTLKILSNYGSVTSSACTVMHRDS